MNVLKPDLQTTIKTLLKKGVSQREIERKTGIDRKTIRRYASRLIRYRPKNLSIQNPPLSRMWPPNGIDLGSFPPPFSIATL
jgi:transposase